VSLVSVVYGAVSGWKKSNKGKAQFEDLKTQVDTSSARADGLLAQVEGLNQEVGAHRKSFAELHAKHEEQSASHAAKHESRAEHGSQAAAALNDKQNAAAAELTV
jgi:C4-type Zn-finger protein